MRMIFATALMILLTASAHAQTVPSVVDEGVSRVKQQTFDITAETRVFVDDGASEIFLRYKNFSADWIRRDVRENFFKLKLDRKILSLMGSGIDCHVALNGYDCHGHFAALPSVGVNLYVRIRPRLDVCLQFSGMTLGSRGHVADFEATVKYFPQKNFSVSAGWRSVDFKLRRGGDSNKFVVSGPFVGVRYDF